MPEDPAQNYLAAAVQFALEHDRDLEWIINEVRYAVQNFTPAPAVVPERSLTEQLAQAVLSLAEDGGMPDSFKESDSRMRLAREALDQ